MRRFARTLRRGDETGLATMLVLAALVDIMYYEPLASGEVSASLPISFMKSKYGTPNQIFKNGRFR